MKTEKKKHDPIIEFLLGSEDFRGLWFGEREEDQPFWWRKHLREYAERMAALSPAKQEWVSVKERLPEPESEYDKFQIVVEYLDNILEEVPKFKRYVDVACFNKKYKCWLTASDGEIIDDREDCNIILWQPLAALPYTEEPGD